MRLILTHVCSSINTHMCLHIQSGNPSWEWVVPFYPVVLEVLQEVVSIVKCWSFTLQPPPSHPSQMSKYIYIYVFRQNGIFALFVRRNGIRQNGIRQNGMTPSTHSYTLWLQECPTCIASYLPLSSSPGRTISYFCHDTKGEGGGESKT